MTKNETFNVTILLFDDVEILDFCGPYEVFSVANRELDRLAFKVHIAAKTELVTTRGGLEVRRNWSLADSPPTDILLVPGGIGVNQLLQNQEILDWVVARSKQSNLTTSVCTGAILLAACRLLDGREATTHHLCFDQLRAVGSNTRVKENCRFVDSGSIITSGGIAAGIDMSLHIVGRLLGPELAIAVAKRMEYEPEAF